MCQHLMSVLAVFTHLPQKARSPVSEATLRPGAPRRELGPPGVVTA